jgi:hypothetical protein
MTAIIILLFSVLHGYDKDRDDITNWRIIRKVFYWSSPDPETLSCKKGKSALLYTRSSQEYLISNSELWFGFVSTITLVIFINLLGPAP